MHFGGVVTRAVLVAKAAVRERVSAAAVGTALALMLGLAGCATSHVATTDADGDGYGTEIDCNDADARVHPGAVEPPADWDCCTSPAMDFDCDGIPLACACNPFPDFDGDGSPQWEDCNDNDPSVYPGAPEEAQFPECCDGGTVDQNCDGAPPICACNPFFDADGDGYDASTDCDDANASVNPGIDEGPCPDGVDQDCDGLDGDPAVRCAEDADGDGYPVTIDCNDLDASVNPGVVEWTCPDGVDQNCDGVDGDPGVICNGMADAPEDDLEHA
jgi:hypothetical protein